MTPQATERIRVLVVDDELHARRGMRVLLERENDVDVIGEASDGNEAIASIQKLCPNLVLLDVTMPDRSGLSVIDEIGVEAMPEVIFVTAFDEYAIPAFEFNALDYILKPFTDERLHKALERARKKLRHAGDDHLGERLLQLLDDAEGRRHGLERFTIKVGDKYNVFEINQIDWVEADEYYVKLHVSGSSYTIRETMNTLEKQLPARHFARIHRSTIVNIDRIDMLEPLFQGDYGVVLKDGTKLRMSRRRRGILSGLIRTFT